MVGKSFEEIEHTADLSLRVWGRDFPELLINAARGMNHLMKPDLMAAAAESIGEKGTERLLDLTAVDRESLLVAWLSELAYLAEAQMLLGCSFSFLVCTDSHLRVSVTLRQEPAIRRFIKAVTYHDLEIKSCDGVLVAQIVFDV